jgi:lactose/L-arabinose transport system substrate-binding protein
VRILDGEAAIPGAIGTGLALASRAPVAAARAAARDALPSTFTFSTWGDFRLYQDAFQRLQKAYPQYAPISFKNQEATAQGSTGGADVLTQRLLAGYLAKAYGTMPDVCELTNYAMSQLAAAGLLVDLTDRIKPYMKGLAPAVIQAVSYNGRIFACPWRANTSQLYYREDVWSEAGVNAASIRTWDDYIAAGKKIKAHKFSDGKQRYITNVDATPGFIFNLLTQQGGQVFDRQGKLLIDTDPRFRRAFQTQLAIIKSGIGVQVTSWTPAWYQGFKDGTISSVVSEVWMDQILQENAPDTSGKWRIMRYPAFAAGGGRDVVDGAAIVVAINKPGLDKDLAWRFMQNSFLTPSVTVQLCNKWYFPPSYLPATSDRSLIYNRPSAFYGGQVIETLDRTVQQHASSPIFNKYYPTAQQYINAAFADAAAGKSSVDAAIKKAASRIRAAMS